MVLLPVPGPLNLHWHEYWRSLIQQAACLETEVSVFFIGFSYIPVIWSADEYSSQWTMEHIDMIHWFCHEPSWYFHQIHYCNAALPLCLIAPAYWKIKANHASTTSCRVSCASSYSNTLFGKRIWMGCDGCASINVAIPLLQHVEADSTICITAWSTQKQCLGQ